MTTTTGTTRPGGSAVGAFRRALAARQSDRAGRRWIFVPYDQLTDALGPLSRLAPAKAGVVLVESPWKARLRPYSKHKLALLLANVRHFALEQAERGVAVRHVVVEGPYRDALAPLAEEVGRLAVMEPAERELRHDLAPLVERGLLEIRPHEGWLTTREQFAAAADGEGGWRMDAFYRRVRRDEGILMEGGSPAGGKYSFDVENRRPWSGEPPAPDPPAFPTDEIKEEVAALVERRFAAHPGRVDPERLPATRRDAEALWSWARRECLPRFGPHEDAMSARSRRLFHTRVSALVNLHRLLPRRLVHEAVALEIPLASKEGFIRQILGWREFVRHVHRETDGLRRLAGRDDPPVAGRIGDAGYGAWTGRAWTASEAPSWLDGGAAPAPGPGSTVPTPPLPLPAAYWGARSGLRCFDRVVEGVLEEGWSHHVERLMVLSNVASLLDVSPRDLTDWFWAAYEDAFDWVVEPNVLGMGTFALGDLMTTKPYVSGSNYIRKMSDFCAECPFDPRTDCPLKSLYWAYLARHEERLAELPRLRLPLAQLARRGAERRARDAAVFRRCRDVLAAGAILGPEDPEL